MISKNELKVSKEDINQIFENIDMNKNGIITLSEFIFGGMKRSEIYTKDCMKEVLRIVDQDQDNLISFTDLRNLLDKDTVSDDMII